MIRLGHFKKTGSIMVINNRAFAVPLSAVRLSNFALQSSCLLNENEVFELGLGRNFLAFFASNNLFDAYKYVEQLNDVNFIYQGNICK